MTRLLLTLLLLAPLPAHALTVKCDSYKSWRNPSFTLQERQDDYLVNWEGKSQTFRKVISKRFGTLIDGGVDAQNPPDEHIFAHETISGVPVIILDSMIFMPACNGWDKNAPKQAVEPQGLWLLKPKL